MKALSTNKRRYKVLYGAQRSQYYLALAVQPSKSLILYDDQLRQVRSIDLKDVVTFQRCISTSTAGNDDYGGQRDIFEIHLSADGSVTLQFMLTSTEEIEDLCRDVQTQFGTPVYSYGSLNKNFRQALGARHVPNASAANKDGKGLPHQYELVKDEFYTSFVTDALTSLGITDNDLDHEHGEPPAEHTNKFPVVIDGTLEETSYLTFRSVKTPHMPPFCVYKVEWFLSKRRGYSKEFRETPSCLGDTFYLTDSMVGFYVLLKVYKAVEGHTNRSYVFATATKGPVRVCSVTAHSMLLNISKDNEVHAVLVKEADLRNIAIQLHKLPKGPKQPPVEQPSVNKPQQMQTAAGKNAGTAAGNPNPKGGSRDVDDSYLADEEDDGSEDLGNAYQAAGEDEVGMGQPPLVGDDPDKRVSHSIVKIEDGNLNEGGEHKGPAPKGGVPKDAAAKAKAVVPKAAGRAFKGKAVQPPMAKAGDGGKTKMKGLMGNLFKKKGLLQAISLPMKGMLGKGKQGAKVEPKPNTAAPPHMSRPAASSNKGVEGAERWIEVMVKNCCKGLQLWSGDMELELPWTRLELLPYCEIDVDKPQDLEDRSRGMLPIKYKCKNETDEVLLPFDIKASSFEQRSTLYHSMIFNKYRRNYYSIDQGERDIHRGYYSDVKDAYVRIWKYIGHRQASNQPNV